MIRTLPRVGLALLLFAVALFFVVAIIAAAPASAQELPEQNNETEPTEVHKTLGDLVIHSVEFLETENGNAIAKIEATWRGNTPETVTVTQLPSGRFGSNTDAVAMSRNRLYPNETVELNIDLVTTSDPAILYTSQSLENERAIKIDDSGFFLFDGPWSAFDAQITGLAGLLAGLGTTTAFALKRTRSSTQEPERKL